MYDYSDRDNKTDRNKALEAFGLTFTLLFTLEAALKILSTGFIVHENAYLRDGWNWIDFTVVIFGYSNCNHYLPFSLIETFPGVPRIRALRTLRVLRPLKSINAVPSKLRF